MKERKEEERKKKKKREKGRKIFFFWVFIFFKIIQILIDQNLKIFFFVVKDSVGTTTL